MGMVVMGARRCSMPLRHSHQPSCSPIEHHRAGFQQAAKEKNDASRSAQTRLPPLRESGPPTLPHVLIGTQVQPTR